jgi:hypothetical protein
MSRRTIIEIEEAQKKAIYTQDFGLVRKVTKDLNDVLHVSVSK